MVCWGIHIIPTLNSGTLKKIFIVLFSFFEYFNTLESTEAMFHISPHPGLAPV